MLTYGGANDEFGDYIDGHFEEILDYLSKSRVVHVTSFTDEKSTAAIARLLNELRTRTPAVLVSCDPGTLWAGRSNNAAVRVLNAADIIMTNSNEFSKLASRLPGMSDQDAAVRLFKNFPEVAGTIVLKDYRRIRLYTPVLSEVTERTYDNPEVLDEKEIVDDTGAGDAFAAGYLTGVTQPGFTTSESVNLGLRLARTKLRFAGTTKIALFKSEFQTLCSSIIDQRRQEPAASHPQVFVGHGRDSEWRSVKDCLDLWGLTPRYFEHTATKGRFVNELLADKSGCRLRRYRCHC